MRAFARPFPIARLSVEARVLYSAFCLFMLMGIGTSTWLAHDDGFGVDPHTVVVWYRGDTVELVDTGNSADTVDPALPDRGTPAGDAGAPGPALTLPDDVDTAPMRLEKPARQVMETFHFHAFTMPICLLVVGHIYMMCSSTTRRKVLVLLVASTSTLLHLLLPPLLRFGPTSMLPGLAALFVPSATAMLVSWLWMLALPLWQMWIPTAVDDSEGPGT